VLVSREVLIPTALPGLATVLMESLYQHRVLSTIQIHDLHTPAAHKSFVRRILAALTAVGVVGHASGGGRLKLWYLTKRGTDAVEMIVTRAEYRRKQITSEQAAGPLRMHTLAVNDVGIAFVNAARQRGDDCGPLAWRHEIAHPIGPSRGKSPRDLLIADALLSYTEQGSDRTLAEHQCFVELDRATIPVRALAEKLDRYASLRDYAPVRYGERPDRGWRANYAQFPGVLVVVAHRDRETLHRRMQNVIALNQTNDGTNGLHVLIGLLEDLHEHGPYAPIFIDPGSPEQYVDWLCKPQP
jgi:Replication-relaxation